MHGVIIQLTTNMDKPTHSFVKIFNMNTHKKYAMLILVILLILGIVHLSQKYSNSDATKVIA